MNEGTDKRWHMYRKVLILMISVIILVLSLSLSGSENQENPLLLYEDEYPQDLDTLEEFIQSYYLLLDSDNYLKSYKFIHPSKNKLKNDQQAMLPFYRKLVELRNARRDKVVVFQIGDSHIQSGYFSGTARSSLQKYYGNAGRGLIFPLRAVKTNQPDDYQISITGDYQKLDGLTSLSGYSLDPGDGMKLKIRTNNFFNIDSRYDELQIFTDSLGTMDPRDNAWSLQHRIEYHGAYRAHYLRLPDYSHECSLGLGNQINELYGISLERSEGGLLYHSMGINGAGFYTLKDKDQFFAQIAITQPDLIIVSLGTNDAQGNYRNDVARRNIEEFMLRLKTANPKAEILFTLPPDSYKRGKVNADLDKLRDEITSYAREYGHAWWDLSEVMGAKGSITKWRNHKMAANDLLHFTPKGYMLQGHLMYQALIKGYKDFSEVQEIK